MKPLVFFIAGIELKSLVGKAVWVREGTQDFMAYEEVVEDNEYELPDSFFQTDVIIDVGAHIGSFAMACMARGARDIRCYEPAADNFPVLRRNVPTAQAHNVAVWASGPNQPHSLLIDRHQERSTAMSYTTPYYNGTPVPCIALDDILADVRECRLLKLDCEGAEYSILFTSRRLRQCREIVGELHHDFEFMGRTTPDLKRHLERQGFEVTVKIHPGAPGILSHFWAKRIE